MWRPQQAKKEDCDTTRRSHMTLTYLLITLSPFCAIVDLVVCE